ncbi:hypothetical protein JIQ42_07616 [Leishmania sp. Namibia]|uniref:hypothetical protein n=1 Tax=Leishmania sp. Namibia TaxID=2802991 RepID=UPI001B4EA5B9|nr:hypothetical protein JIQ42_07616 [Leishmania sp. Namibia]
MFGTDTVYSSPQDDARVASASPSGHNAATVDTVPHPSVSATPTAAAAAPSVTAGMSGAEAVDFSRWEANAILEALLCMSSGENGGGRWQGQAADATDLQTGRSSTPLEPNSSVAKALLWAVPPPQQQPQTASVHSRGEEKLMSSRAPSASAPGPPAASAVREQRPSSLAVSPPAPFFQEDAAVHSKNQTPTQRHVAVAHTSVMERRDDDVVQRHARAGTAPTAGVDSTGLVSSAVASRSATTAASRLSPQGDGSLGETALLRGRYAPVHVPEPANATGSSGPAAASQSATVSTEVGGALWQQAFAAHAQRLLRETQRQVDELRRCQQKAVREAQRADAVAAAYRVLEVQLVEADAKRAEERAAHEAAVTELSQQVLRLEEGVGMLRRTKLDLQRQLKGAQTAAAQQEEEHQRQLRELRSALESEAEGVRTEQHLQADESRQERRRLKEKLAERESTGITVATRKVQLEARGVGLEGRHTHAKAASLQGASLPSCETGGERDALVLRVDAATSTDEGALPATAAPPQEDTASPYTRLHPDVLAQQKLREQTILSQLSIADARIQQEWKQRRLAEERVAELLAQNEQLREALASAETTAIDAGRVSESEHRRQQQQQLLREIQHEYRELRRESTALFARHKAQQRRETERWIAVRSAVGDVLHVVGLQDAQSALEPAVAADTSHLGCLGDVLTDPSEASLHSTLAALETLASTLRSQQKATAAAEAVLQEQRRLSTLEEAVREAEAQSQAHMASLKAAEAQLCESQRELAVWQKRQRKLEDRQAAQDATWRSAEMQLKQVANLVRRALREYARPLPVSLLKSSAAGDAAGDGTQSAGGLVARRDTCTPKQRSLSSPARTASLGGVEESGSDAAMVPTTADTALVWASDRDAVAAAYEGDLLRHAFAPQRVACEADEAEEPVAVAVSEGDSPSRPTAALTRSSMVTLVATEFADAGSDAAQSGVRRDMAVIARGLLKLLARWRTRQHTLVEAVKALQRLVADVTAKSAALAEEQRETEAYHQQQLRLSRAAEQRRAHQLEQAQQELKDARRQRVLDSAQAHHKAAEWESERDVLRQRLCVAEEKLNRAEQSLVEADVDHSAQHASHEALQHALSEVTAARDRLERRQADLSVHIEDLEARLLVADRTQTGLHALITIAVAFIVRLLADHQQLQGHYRVLRTLAWADAQTLSVVERVLERSFSRSDELVAAATQERGPRWPAGAASGASAWPAVAVPPPAAPATRLRAAGHVVRAVMRLSRLLAARQRLRGNAGTRRRDGASHSHSASAMEPAELQPLLLALASAFTWGAATPVLTSAGASPQHNLLQRYTARPAACVLPVVRLPPPLELAAVAHNEVAWVEAGGHGERHRERLDDSGGAYENEEVYIGAGHPQRQLVQLLTMAQIDVRDPATRHLWGGVEAAGSASARATAALLRRVQVRQALSENVLTPRGDRTKVIPPLHSVAQVLDLRPLLPDRLAALLQLHLERTTTQARHVAESNILLQRMVLQNQKLVSALERRTREQDAASAELQSLTSQLQQQQAEREERTVVQEKLVETRASLLQERRQRREAEERLAKLQQERLQWLSDQEQYKREVYALNMELANISLGSAPPFGGNMGALSPARGSDAEPAPAKSAWSMCVDDAAVTEAVRRAASPPQHFDPLSSRSRNGSAVHRCQHAHGSHPPVSCTAPSAAEVDWHPCSETAYYYQLLRNDHQRDRHSVGEQQHHGSNGMNAKAQEMSDAHAGTPSSPTLRYRPRTSLLTPERLAQSAWPGQTCSPVAASGRERVVRSASDTGASPWNAQLQHQAPTTPSMTATSMATLTTAARAETPPKPQPLPRSANSLEFYVPNVARQREAAGSDTAEHVAERGLDTITISAWGAKTRNEDGFRIGNGTAEAPASSPPLPAEAPVSDVDGCAATPPPLTALPPRPSHPALRSPPPLTVGTVTAGERGRGSMRQQHAQHRSLQEEERPQQLRTSAQCATEPPSAPAATFASPVSVFDPFLAPRPPPLKPSPHRASASASHETNTVAPVSSREMFAPLPPPSAAAPMSHRDGGFHTARDAAAEASGATLHVSGPLYFTTRSAQ